MSRAGLKSWNFRQSLTEVFNFLCEFSRYKISSEVEEVENSSDLNSVRKQKLKATEAEMSN